MKIQIKRIDKKLPLPQYETAGSVGLDLICRTTVKIKSSESILIPVNIIVQVPKNLMLIIVPRSSMYRKKGLIFPHSIGIIDQDFCGPKDELMLQVLNISKKVAIVERGERIAQGVFVSIEKAEWQETNLIQKKSRGGFGATG